MKYGEIVPLSEIQHLLDEDSDRDKRVADMKVDISELKVGQVMKFTTTNETGFAVKGFLALLTVDLRGKFQSYQEGRFVYIHRTE